MASKSTKQPAQNSNQPATKPAAAKKPAAKRTSAKQAKANKAAAIAKAKAEVLENAAAAAPSEFARTAIHVNEDWPGDVKPGEVSLAALQLMPQKLTWRESTDKDHVAELVHALKSGATLPPIAVAFWGKTGAALVDGHHRLAARVEVAGKQGAAETIAEVNVHRVASEADAMALAFSLNVSHGLNLTPAEKRQAILRMIAMPAFEKLSNVKLAAVFGCSDMTIKRYRDAVEATNQHAKHGNRPAARAPKASTSTAKGGGTVAGRGKADGSNGKADAEPQAAPKGLAATTSAGQKVQLQAISRLCGGAEYIAEAIIKRITHENDGKLVTGTALDEAVTVAAKVAALLQAWVDEHEAENVEAAAVTAQIEAAKAATPAKGRKAGAAA